MRSVIWHSIIFLILIFSKRKLLYLYGKWTEGLRSCDPLLYEDALEKVRRETKSPLGSSGHKKVLAKLHSLKVGAFKPVHQVGLQYSYKFVFFITIMYAIILCLQTYVYV